MKAERDAQASELYERSLKMEAEVRAIDEMSAELAQVRSDVQKLGGARQELSAKLQAIEDDLARARLESQQIPSIKANIESVHKEIQRGRSFFPDFIFFMQFYSHLLFIFMHLIETRQI